MTIRTARPLGLDLRALDPGAPSRRTALGAGVAAAALLLAGCARGEDSSGAAPTSSAASSSGASSAPRTLTLDFATYNPLSLVVKQQRWLEDSLAAKDVTVSWVQSAGSNKANEFLRNGNIDVGSTAGSAALLARANGSPIKTIDVFSQPDWAALVVRPGSSITEVADLKGKQVAATTGTDPYFFLVQALAKAGLTTQDVTVQNLQHADGRTALDAGHVDAWAGLDPIMAAAQAQDDDRILYSNVAFNSYGLLNATEDFLSTSPDLAQAVVDAYERARAWVAKHQAQTAQVLAQVAGIDVAIATATLARTKLAIDPVPGAAQRAVLTRIGPVLVSDGDVGTQAAVDDALASLFAPRYAKRADPTRVSGASAASSSS